MDNDHDPAPRRASATARARLRRRDPVLAAAAIFRPGAALPEPVPEAPVPSQFDSSGVSLERHQRELDNASFNEHYLLAPMGYFLVGLDRHILQANLSGAAMLGIARSALAGQSFHAHVTHPFQPDFDALFARALNSATPLSCRVRMRRAREGDAFQATLHASADGSGQACRIAIEPAEGLAEALARSEERFRRVVHSAEEGIWEIDAAAATSFVNPRMAAMLGYSIEEMVGQPLSAFVDEDGLAAMHACIARRRQGISERHEFKFVARDGGAVWTMLSTTPIVDAAGRYTGALALVTDITARKETAALLWRQANFDTLTGLANRHMFMDRLLQAMTKADRSAGFLALVLIDLDHFGELNKRLGPARGDLLLIEAGRRIGGCVRASDTLARLGGDEFAVVLADLDHVGSVERVARQMTDVLAVPFDIQGQHVFVTASIGIALYPPDAPDIDALMAHAGDAVRVTKQGGGHGFGYYTPQLQEAALARQNMAADLREALHLGQFEIAYQPIVTLATGAVHKAEALLRWRHPSRGLLQPAQFLPFAESNGLIVDIGDWVFREVAQQTQRWQRSIAPGFQVSVNKSPVQFRHDARLYENWLAYLTELGLPAQSIVVEINERVLLEGAEQVVERLRQFRAMGLQVALDDFGTGYASLSHLQRYDIDYVKIDQSFVSRLEDDVGDLALCEAIIVMAHKLGLKVVAEGVETKVQRALLVDAGCDYAQGFMFARPMTAQQLEAMATADVPRFPH